MWKTLSAVSKICSFLKAAANLYFFLVIYPCHTDSYIWDEKPIWARWASSCCLWESEQCICTPAGVPSQCSARPVGGAATAGPGGTAGARGNRRGWWGDLGLAQKTRSAPATRAGALYFPCRSAAGLSPFAVPDSQWSGTLRCHSRGTASLPPGLPAAQPQQRARWLPQWPGGAALLLAGRWCPGVRPTAGAGSDTGPPHTQTEGKCCCCTCGTCLCQVRPYIFLFMSH